MLWILLLTLAQVTTPTFVTIAQGRNSGIAEPREAIVRVAAEWQALWKSHGSTETAPPVDFSKEVIAAVFLGTRPTGGYNVEIVATRLEANTLIVEYVERQPEPGAIVTQALTAPFHIVKLTKYDGPVVFRKVARPVF